MVNMTVRRSSGRTGYANINQGKLLMVSCNTAGCSPETMIAGTTRFQIDSSSGSKSGPEQSPRRGGVILPVVPKFLDLYVSGLVGHGNGRYGASQLGDSTVNPSGALSALEEKQGFVRLLAHPSPMLDVYLYAGTEQSQAVNSLIPADNSACNTNYAELISLPKDAGCGAVGKVRGFAAGFYWKVYRGKMGYLTTGPELEYVTDTTYTAANGTVGRTKDPMVFLTFRYYPFQ